MGGDQPVPNSLHNCVNVTRANRTGGIFNSTNPAGLINGPGRVLRDRVVEADAGASGAGINIDPPTGVFENQIFFEDIVDEAGPCQTSPVAGIAGDDAVPHLGDGGRSADGNPIPAAVLDCASINGGAGGTGNVNPVAGGALHPNVLDQSVVAGHGDAVVRPRSKSGDVEPAELHVIGADRDGNSSGRRNKLKSVAWAAELYVIGRNGDFLRGLDYSGRCQSEDDVVGCADGRGQSLGLGKSRHRCRRSRSVVAINTAGWGPVPDATHRNGPTPERFDHVQCGVIRGRRYHRGRGRLGDGHLGVLGRKDRGVVVDVGCNQIPPSDEAKDGPTLRHRREPPVFDLLIGPRLKRQSPIIDQFQGDTHQNTPTQVLLTGGVDDLSHLQIMIFLLKQPDIVVQILNRKLSLGFFDGDYLKGFIKNEGHFISLPSGAPQ